MTAAVACACAAIFAASSPAAEPEPVPAPEPVRFGANDDTGKYSLDGGAVYFPQMAAAGLRQNVMTVRWKPSDPLNIPDRAALDVAVPNAVAAGIEVVFAVYPYPPSELEVGGVSHLAFAAWLDQLARAYPQVTTYIVGNEPNLNTFWRPQGSGGGRILSAAQFGRFLAAGYDALKTVSPEITVLGVGSSPRGDRAPGSAGKSSPVHFLAALGAWYRASLRPTPIMDGFSYHPYPNPSDFTVPFTFTYGWPNASVLELARIKQALWDAFDGTPQPTTLNGLKLYLDEVGWQVDTSTQPGYRDAENVRVTSEETQAAIYAELVRYVVCDADVAQLNFFGYYDEPTRLGWQAALRRTDGSERASHAAVAAAIAETGGKCWSPPRIWQPLRKPERAAVTFMGGTGIRAGTRRPLVRPHRSRGRDRDGRDRPCLDRRRRSSGTAHQSGNGRPEAPNRAGRHGQARSASELHRRGHAGVQAEPRADLDLQEPPLRGRSRLPARTGVSSGAVGRVPRRRLPVQPPAGGEKHGSRPTG